MDNRRRTTSLIRQVKQLMFQYREREQGDIKLDQRRVYIVPSRAGFVFAILMVIMLIGSINYSLNLGFVLTFMLAGSAVVAMYITHGNMTGLILHPVRAEPIFAGEMARFQVALDNPSKRERIAIHIHFTGLADPLINIASVDIAAQSKQLVSLACPSKQRGWLAAPRIRLGTLFPLGLWRVWSYWRPDMHCLVYPAPENNPPPLPLTGMGQGETNGQIGHEDLAGIRPYQQGDTPRQIAWKAVAKTDHLVAKHFQGGASTEVWLDWFQITDISHEDRLSRMTAWVLQAEASQTLYGLRLPQIQLAPDLGAQHRDACLEALALC